MDNEHENGAKSDWRTRVAAAPRAFAATDPVGYLLWQWDSEKLSPWRARVIRLWAAHQQRVKLGCMLVSAFLLGAILTGRPSIELRNIALREQLHHTRNELTAREGELELARLDLARSSTILDYSSRNAIPGDLAASIYDIAVSEGIDPKVAFALISVESDFTQHAISPVGAIGLAQVMPATAAWLQPGIPHDKLFDRETNLRLGFRYLHMLLEQYKGNLHLALLAYNRGPARVDEILQAGGNPSNGYTTMIHERGGNVAQ